MSKRWWFNVITFSVGVLTLLVCGWIINPMLVVIVLGFALTLPTFLQRN